MLFNVPLKNSATQDQAAFQTHNAAVLQKLVAFTTLSQNFTLGFVISPSPQETDWCIDFLRRHPDCQELDFVVLDFPDPNLRFLLEPIRQALPSTQTGAKQRVLILRGLEQAIGVLEPYPPLLVNLNFSRDSYRRQMPYPVLLMLPDYGVTRLARFAPDFWAWKSAEFRLEVVRPAELPSLMIAVSPELATTQRFTPVSQERFDLLQELLQEYNGCTLTRADLLKQLGQAHLSQAKFGQAKSSLLEALQIYENVCLNLLIALSFNGQK